MRTVRVTRAKLIEILTENRAKHRQVFEAALAGYKERLAAELERKLEDLRAGRRVDSQIQLVVPEDHTRDYDRVLRQLELSVDETLELSDQEFAQYVMDQWGWFASFAATSVAYDAGAVRAAYGPDVESGQDEADPW